MSRSSSADQRARRWAWSRRLTDWGLHAAAALLVSLLGGHALGWWTLAPVERLDLTLYDLRLGAFATPARDERIVLVDVDQRALAEHGRWPWPRARLAELLERVQASGPASLVVLDMALAEAESQTATASSGDQRLAQALRGSPAVLGFMLSDDRSGTSIGRLPAGLPAQALGPRLADLPAHTGVIGNLALFAQAADAAGHLNAEVDADGRLRRLPLLARSPDGRVHPSLALAAVLRLMQLDDAALRAEPGAAGASQEPLRALHLGAGPSARRIAVGRHAEVLVPFRPGEGRFVHRSAAELLDGSLPAGALAGKVVVVAVAAPGLADQRMTPLDDAMPGAQVHANLIAALLDGDTRSVPAAAPLAELGSLLLVAVVTVWGVRRLGMASGSALAALVLAALAMANAAAWAWAQLAFPMAGTLLMVPLLLGLHLALAYRSVNSARHRLHRLFGQYVPPELVDEMSRDAERYAGMTSRSVELSVLFADVHGFSRIAARLPPGELSAMMNLIFSHLTDIVRAHRGTLDKYIGDAVMAFWGAPLDDPHHARHAVAAALAMRERLPGLNAELAARGWPAIDVRIGVNTGPVVVGDMGSRHRRAYTVLGDPVNLAARLQQFASDEGLGLVVGESTRQALGRQTCLPLGVIHLRGRDEPEPVWHPLPARSGQSPGPERLLALWHQVREAGEQGRPAQALAQLRSLEHLPGMQPLCSWQRGRLEALLR